MNINPTIKLTHIRLQSIPYGQKHTKGLLWGIRNNKTRKYSLNSITMQEIADMIGSSNIPTEQYEVDWLF